MTEELTQEDRKQLIRPFHPDAVKFRIDGRPTDGGKVRILTYIDSRLAVERLRDVDMNVQLGPPEFPGGSVNDPIGLKVGLPVVYPITLKGSKVADVGQIGPAAWGDNKGEYEADEKHVKMAVSDAIKRSAVLLGVGAYLYTLGNIVVDVKNHTVGGKGKTLNNAGKNFLKQKYTEVISSKAFVDRFGEPVDYGDSIANSSVEVSDVPTTSVPIKTEASGSSDNGASDSPATTNLSEETESTTTLDGYDKVVADLAKATNRSPEAAIKWMQARKNKELGVKRAVKQAGERGASKEEVESILKEHGMSKHLKSFVELVTA